MRDIRLITALYRGVDDDEALAEAVQGIGAYNPDGVTSLWFMTHDNSAASVAICANDPDDLSRAYGEYYHSLDPLAHLAGTAPADGIVSSAAAMPRRDFSRLEFTNDFLRKRFGAERVEAIRAVGGRNASGFLTATIASRTEERRASQMRRLLDTVRKDLQFVMHLRQCRRIHDGRTRRSHLHALDTAAALLGKGGRIIALNEAAATLLASEPARGRRPDGTPVVRLGPSDALQRFIELFFASGKATARTRITDSLGRRIGVLAVRETAPARTAAIEAAFDDVPQPAATVHFQVLGTPPLSDDLVRSYRLTAAEALVAAHLAAGNSIVVTAALTAMSRTRVSDLLAGVSRKIGTSCREELAIHLARSR
jgi:hypothetical protein